MTEHTLYYDPLLTRSNTYDVRDGSILARIRVTDVSPSQIACIPFSRTARKGCKLLTRIDGERWRLEACAPNGMLPVMVLVLYGFPEAQGSWPPPARYT